MNTKQAEELTGISRQNIRYYERQGLLEPARETGNAYRDYSEEEIRRLKLIKMLRMLDMPLKEIENILKEELPLKEAVVRQQENLLKQQKQLQAAIEVCTSIHKDQSDQVDVDAYLEKMETMSRNGSVFAKIADDYKRVAMEEQQRRFSFNADEAVNTAGMFEAVLRKYASDRGMKFQMVKSGMYPKFTLDGTVYTAARVLEDSEETREASTRILCIRENEESIKKEIPDKRRSFYQGIHTILVNIRRHYKKSILNILISLLTVIVMALYLGNLTSTKQQLDELPERLPISVQIWNVSGDSNSGLFIQPRVLDAVYGSSYTKEIVEGAKLLGRLPQENAENLQDLWVQGLNRPECIEGLEEEDVKWSKVWDWDTFQKSHDVCIVNQSSIDKELGSRLPLSLQHYQLLLSGTGLEIKDLRPVSMEVVGIWDSSGTDEEVTVPDILFPLDAVKEIYKQSGQTYFASSLSFLVKDSMKLNELKQELKDAGLQTVVPGSTFSYAGAGVRVDDVIFIRSVTSLEKSLSLLQGFLPFVLLVVIMVGYIVSHLLLQGRREEYAIMRALGTSRRRCTVLFFVEHILLAAAGGAVGAAAGLILRWAGMGAIALVWLVFLVCYILGASAAMWMFGRFSVAAVLSHRD